MSSESLSSYHPPKTTARGKRNKSAESRTATSTEKTKVQAYSQPSKIVGVLNELKDDIVSCPQVCKDSVSGSSQLDSFPCVQSGTGDVYVEHNGKFIKAPKELVENPDFFRKSVFMEETGSVGHSTPLDIALTIQKTCTTISRILLGLLGGVSLLKLLLVAFLHISWEAQGQLVLTEFYAVLVEISSTLYSIMFPICLVSLLDWLDVAHSDLKHILNSLLGKQIFLVNLIYIISFFIYLAAVPYNDFIISLWNDKPEINENTLVHWMDTWKNLTLVYTALCCAGWMITALTRNEDAFYLHLLDMKKFEDDCGHLTIENHM